MGHKDDLLKRLKAFSAGGQPHWKARSVPFSSFMWLVLLLTACSPCRTSHSLQPVPQRTHRGMQPVAAQAATGILLLSLSGQVPHGHCVKLLEKRRAEMLVQPSEGHDNSWAAGARDTCTVQQVEDQMAFVSLGLFGLLPPPLMLNATCLPGEPVGDGPSLQGAYPPNGVPTYYWCNCNWQTSSWAYGHLTSASSCSSSATGLLL